MREDIIEGIEQMEREVTDAVTDGVIRFVGRVLDQEGYGCGYIEAWQRVYSSLVLGDVTIRDRTRGVWGDYWVRDLELTAVAWRTDRKKVLEDLNKLEEEEALCKKRWLCEWLMSATWQSTLLGGYRNDAFKYFKKQGEQRKRFEETEMVLELFLDLWQTRSLDAKKKLVALLDDLLGRVTDNNILDPKIWEVGRPLLTEHFLIRLGFLVTNGYVGKSSYDDTMKRDFLLRLRDFLQVERVLLKTMIKEGKRWPMDFVEEGNVEIGEKESLEEVFGEKGAKVIRAMAAGEKPWIQVVREGGKIGLRWLVKGQGGSVRTRFWAFFCYELSYYNKVKWNHTDNMSWVELNERFGIKDDPDKLRDVVNRYYKNDKEEDRVPDKYGFRQWKKLRSKEKEIKEFFKAEDK